MTKQNKTRLITFLLISTLLVNLLTGCSKGSVTASGKVTDKLELAVKYLVENKFEEAILAYQEAIKIDSLAVKAYQGLGKTYALQGKYEEAQKIYDQGIGTLKDKALTQLRLSLAGMYIDKGDLDQAEQIYKQIISQDPDAVEPYQGLALVYHQKGDTEKARAILEEAVKANSGDSSVYAALADYYLKNNQKDKAMELLIQSLSKDINQTEAYASLKGMYSSDWDELIQKTAGIQDQNIASMLKFYALYESGRYQEALALYDGQIKQNTGNQKATALAGIAAFHAGDKNKAQEIIQSLTAGQQNEWVMADIARYFLLAGEKEKAIEWAAKSFEANGQNIEAVKVLYEIYSKDNNPLSRIYVAKLIMYSWLPLSVMERELYANSIEMPFELNSIESGKLTYDYFIPKLGYQYVYKIASTFGNQGMRSYNVLKDWEMITHDQYQETTSFEDDRRLDVSLFKVENNGVYQIKRQLDEPTDGKDTTEFVGNNPVLRYVMPGSSWENNYQSKTIHYDYEFQRTYNSTGNFVKNYKFVEFIKIKVIDKEMQAAHIFCDCNIFSDSSGTTAKTNEEFWLVKDLGIVKHNYSFVGKDDSYNLSSELISVSPL